MTRLTCLRPARHDHAMRYRVQLAEGSA
jgi:hypothetical protein